MKKYRKIKFSIFALITIVLVFLPASNCHIYSPPLNIEFAEDPPTQVFNCTGDTCKVILKIKANFYIFFPHVKSNGKSIDSSASHIVGKTFDISFTLQRGVNHLEICCPGEGSQSNVLQCSIECVCPQQSGYVLKDTIGTDSVKTPVDINADKNNHMIVLSKIENQNTKIMKLFADLGQVHEYYTGVTYPGNPVGITAGADFTELLLLCENKIQELSNTGMVTNEYPFSANQKSEKGQINNSNNLVRSISRKTTEIGFDYLNTLVIENPGQNYGTGIETNYHGVDTIDIPGHDKNGNVVMYSYVGSSSARAVQQAICIDPENYQSIGVLFDIPESDGIPKDISIYPNKSSEFECIISTEKTDGSFWVNIYTEDGTKTNSFKSHDTYTGTENTDDYIFSAMKGRDDDYIYVIHSLFPGIQIWEYQQ